MAYDSLSYKKRSSVATVIINRPHKRSAGRLSGRFAQPNCATAGVDAAGLRLCPMVGCPAAVDSHETCTA